MLRLTFRLPSDSLRMIPGVPRIDRDGEEEGVGDGVRTNDWLGDVEGENDVGGDDGRCTDFGLGDEVIPPLGLGRTASTLEFDMIEFMVATDIRGLCVRRVEVESYPLAALLKRSSMSNSSPRSNSSKNCSCWLKELNVLYIVDGRCGRSRGRERDVRTLRIEDRLARPSVSTSLCALANSSTASSHCSFCTPSLNVVETGLSRTERSLMTLAGRWEGCGNTNPFRTPGSGQDMLRGLRTGGGRSW